jgi:thioredoxin reductase
MSETIDVAVVGAGPYGLSIGAYLSAYRLNARIFGPPMQTWQTAMPRGMMLKSEGFASSLYDPTEALTLAKYCAAQGLPYQDVGLPVPVETFIEYGLEFQRHFLPDLDTRQIISLRRTAVGFSLTLDDGDEFHARRVVVATGISNYDYIPPELSGFPAELVSHSSAESDVARIAGGAAGKEILVIGAGASAIDLAALLHQSGASVTIVARRTSIPYCGAPRPRTWMDELQAPLSGLGTGWRSLACVKAPLVFHHMPEAFRLLVVQKHLGPAPGWVPREHIEKHVPVKFGATIGGARVTGRRIELSVRIAGETHEMSADHIVAATGFRPDLRRLGFLTPGIREGIRQAQHTPILDTNFQSSIPGLYFTGISAANSFGPLLRFAYGAGFAARRLTQHLRRTAAASHHPVGRTSRQRVPGIAVGAMPSAQQDASPST